MAIDFQDNFKIIRKYQITGEDLTSLTQLYLPLIGIDSFGLYLVLTTQNEKESYSFKKLLDILSFSKISILQHALEKAEAVGLVRTYINKENCYLLEMNSPLNGLNFFKSGILTEYLTGQLGVTETDKLKEKFNRKSVKGYNEITKSFDEVFQTSTQSVNDIYSIIANSKSFNPIRIKEIDFDYVLFKMSFNDDLIGEDVLNEPDFRKNILETAHVYHLNEEEMKDVILTTINIDKELTFDYINKNARLLYRKKSNSQTIHLETKAADSFIASNLDDDTYKLISYCENTSFADVLKSLSGITPAQSELRMFDDLKKNTNFSNGVINMMILYVSNTLNGVLPSYNYFEKVANSWARAEIKTALDASNYLLKMKNEPTKQKNHKGLRVVEKPEWYDNYLKEFEKAKTKKPDTEEELIAALEEARRLREERD